MIVQICVLDWVSVLNILQFVYAMQVSVPSCVGPVGALSCVTPSCFVMKSSLPSLLPSFMKKKKDAKNGKEGTLNMKTTKPKMEMGYLVCIDLFGSLTNCPKCLISLSSSKWDDKQGSVVICLCSCVILLMLPDKLAQVTSLPELIAEPTGARSMSFVGTHEYLAPEIIKGR